MWRLLVTPYKKGVYTVTATANEHISFAFGQPAQRLQRRTEVIWRVVRFGSIKLFFVGDCDRCLWTKPGVIFDNDYDGINDLNCLPYPKVIAVDVDRQQTNLT